MVCSCGIGSEELAMSSMSRSGPMVCTVLYAVLAERWLGLDCGLLTQAGGG